MNYLHLGFRVFLAVASGASAGQLLYVAASLTFDQMAARRLSLNQYYRLRRHGFIAIACFVVFTGLYFLVPK